MTPPQHRSGLVLIRKPAGMTSFDCIRSLKRAWQRTDLGHGGTLDQFATGLLPVLAGEGLKLARFFLENHPTLPTFWKTYRARLRLGHETDTGDPSGERIVEDIQAPNIISETSILSAMNEFLGRPYLQMPPIYSAKKIQGQRSSDLARAGATPELKAVNVDIRTIDLVRFEGTEIEFDVTCSKGTYIRVLAQDLARKLGTRGHLVALERTKVGDFTLDAAVTLEQALSTTDFGIKNINETTTFLPTLLVNAEESQNLAFGRLTEIMNRVKAEPVGAYCLRNTNGTALAIMQCHEASSGERSAEFLRAFVVSET